MNGLDGWQPSGDLEYWEYDPTSGRWPWLDRFLTKLADCFKRDEGPYLRIVAGREGVDRVSPYWYEPRGKLTLFELPSCDEATELVERTVVTLANLGDWKFFEEAMELDDGTGHPALCGRLE